MRVGNTNLQEIKSKIEKLKGEELDMVINKGRNKIVNIKAIIDKIYPSMFIIKPTSVVDLDRFSFSYSDLMCGDIKINNL